MLTQERLKALLHYDAARGAFTWSMERRCGEFRSVVVVRAGDVAGGKRPDGYRSISLDSKRYLEHVLAWLYVFGEVPPRGMDIDHINGQRDDNRLSNLRLASRSKNQQNLRGAKRSNRSSGVLGVYWHAQGSCWRARITVNGKTHHVGLYPTVAEAAAARSAAEQRYFTHAPMRNY